MSDSASHKDGYLDIKQLPEGIEDLYQIPMEVAQQAFCSATTRSGLIFQYSLIFPYSDAFSAWSTNITQEQAQIGISAAVPILWLQTCLLYSSRVDTETALPKTTDDEKLLVYADKLRIDRTLKTTPHCAADITNMVEDLMGFSDQFGFNVPYGLLLYEIGIRYIAWHEVMHIILGHTAYVHEQYDDQRFVEFGTVREQRYDSEIMHCMEFLADRNALRGLTAKYLSRETDYNNRAIRQLLSNTDVNPVSYILRCVQSTVTLIFHLFTTNESELGLPTNTHPSPFLRAQWAAVEIGHQVDDKSQIKSALFKTQAMVAATLNTNYVCPGSWMSAAEIDMASATEKNEHISDKTYKQMLDLSQKWSTYWHKNYGPLYTFD